MPSERTSCFVDTNLLVYSLDPRETERRRAAGALLKNLVDTGTLVLSPQSLNECYRALTERRDLLPRHAARAYVVSLLRFCTAPYDFDVTRRAWQIQEQHRFGWWDTMLLASASLARCSVRSCRHATCVSARRGSSAYPILCSISGGDAKKRLRLGSLKRA